MQTISVTCAGLGSEDEVKLVNTLFENDGYNPLIRPVRNLSETVTVKFGLAMIQLINVVSVAVLDGFTTRDVSQCGPALSDYCSSDTVFSGSLLRSIDRIRLIVGSLRVLAVKVLSIGVVVTVCCQNIHFAIKRSLKLLQMHENIEYVT